MVELLQIVLAYWLVDALGGLYHLATDRGFNIASQVAFFQKHHESPETMTFDLQPCLIGVPCLVAGWFVAPWFLVPLGIFFCLAQVPHYYTHFPAPRFVQVLQRAGIFVSPASHARHHDGRFDRDFCVTAGWNNWWINWIASQV